MGLQAVVNLPDDLLQINETANITVTWTVRMLEFNMILLLSSFF